MLQLVDITFKVVYQAGEFSIRIAKQILKMPIVPDNSTNNHTKNQFFHLDTPYNSVLTLMSWFTFPSFKIQDARCSFIDPEVSL